MGFTQCKRRYKMIVDIHHFLFIDIITFINMFLSLAQTGYFKTVTRYDRVKCQKLRAPDTRCQCPRMLSDAKYNNTSHIPVHKVYTSCKLSQGNAKITFKK